MAMTETPPEHLETSLSSASSSGVRADWRDGLKKVLGQYQTRLNQVLHKDTVQSDAKQQFIVNFMNHCRGDWFRLLEQFKNQLGEFDHRSGISTSQERFEECIDLEVEAHMGTLAVPTKNKGRVHICMNETLMVVVIATYEPHNPRRAHSTVQFRIEDLSIERLAYEISKGIAIILDHYLPAGMVHDSGSPVR